jgi:hypothetical protein
MKKIMLVGAVALLALASCKKDRTCECTYNGVADTDKTPETYKKVTKTFMKNNVGCVSYERVEDGVSYKQECEIK